MKPKKLEFEMVDLNLKGVEWVSFHFDKYFGRIESFGSGILRPKLKPNTRFFKVADLPPNLDGYWIHPWGFESDRVGWVFWVAGQPYLGV